jgi:GTP-binding protein
MGRVCVFAWRRSIRHHFGQSLALAPTASRVHGPPRVSTRDDIRNLAIIAHVDHGKTTLVDALLRVAGAFDRTEIGVERAMDSGDLERERGITITSKPTALSWKDHRINLVDTPGHSDFGGEVERVLNMVDAVLVVVDAFEGPMPQTRFVTEKAVNMGLKILVVVNKIDRDGSNPHGTVDATFDLLDNLGASHDQLDFPVVFCSARERYAVLEPDDPDGERLPISRVLDLIIEHAPAPKVELDAPPAMWVSTLHHDNYLGFLAIGRIDSGVITSGGRLAQIRPDATRPPSAYLDCVEVFRVAKLLAFQGLRRFEVTEAKAGDIVAIAGMSSLQVGDTLTDPEIDRRRMFPALSVDPPTLSVRFRVNDGPFAGKEGKWVTSRKLSERLFRETRSNVALKVEATELAEEFEVSGRGELHLSVLMETMRREGYEFCVSRPRVILRENAAGKTEEPYENLVVQTASEYAGAVIEKLGRRSAEMQSMDDLGNGRTKLGFRIPSRGLIGYRSEFMTDTRGTGIMASVFAEYGPHLGINRNRPRGVLIVLENGETMTYSLNRLQERGVLFVGPQVQTYAGMIIGEHSRENDLVVNPNINKKFTNVRSSGADEKVFLTPPRELTLEDALAYIEDDELIEVTPQSLRLRKRWLDHNMRKRMDKARAAV